MSDIYHHVIHTYQKGITSKRLGIMFVDLKYMYLILFGGSEITADGDCSHEIKRNLLLGKL